MIDRHRVAALTAAGYTSAEIAIELGCSPRHVTRLRSGKTTGNLETRLFNADDVLQIEAMLADGCSYTEIGRTVRRSPNVISRRWPGHGWGFREAGEFRKFTQKLEAAILEAWPTLATR